MSKVLVIGAGGVVGRAISRRLAAGGHAVVAVGRHLGALQALAAEAAGVRPLPADLGDEEGARALAAGLGAEGGAFDAVVTSVNPPRSTMRLTEAPTADFLHYLAGTLGVHLNAAKHLAPLLAAGGSYVAIGGASSDFVWPEHGHISTNQAAQRMLLQVLAHELSGLPIFVREYVIAAMVHDGSGSQGISAAELAEHFVGQLFAARPPRQVRFPPSPPPA